MSRFGAEAALLCGALGVLPACADGDPVHHARPGDTDNSTVPLDSQETGAEDSTPDSPSDSEETDSQSPCRPGAALVGETCMDIYEAPNVASALPLVMYTYEEAQAWCGVRGKRLCTDAEWQTACEGGDGDGGDVSDYVYGDAHEPGRCNDEETWRVYDQDALNQWPPSASSTGVESLEELFAAAGSATGEVESLYQGEGGGVNARCVNTYGVYDLTGNVEEWTERADGGASQFHGNLKGRYWAESRTCQSNVTVHGDTFRFYEIGFRCCQGAWGS